MYVVMHFDPSFLVDDDDDDDDDDDKTSSNELEDRGREIKTSNPWWKGWYTIGIGTDIYRDGHMGCPTVVQKRVMNKIKKNLQKVD